MNTLSHIDRLHVMSLPGHEMLERKNMRDRDQVLFARYSSKVQEIAQNDRNLLITLLCKPLSTNSPEEAFVSEQIQQFKEKLMQRMIIISDGLMVVRCGNQRAWNALDRMAKVAKARGFEIDSSTQAEIFGETLHGSVQYMGWKIHDTFGLESPAVLSVHNTDIGVEEGETREEQRARFARMEREDPDSRLCLDWSVPT